MPRPRRTLRAAIGLFTLIVALAGACSSSSSTVATSADDEATARVDERLVDGTDGSRTDDDQPDDGAPAEIDEADLADDESSAAEADLADDGASAAEPVEYRSPIAEFLGSDFTDRERTEADIRKLEAEAEVLTAQCMQEQGFKYVPRDSSDMVFFSDQALDPTSDEYIETYGFGITTQWFPQSMVGPNLVGFPDEQMGGPFGPDDDPNQDYVDSLSPGARDAYFAALYGEPPEFDPSTMTDDEMNEAMQAFEPGGCSNEARQELFGGGAFGPGREFYETFGDQMESLYERVESDPRIVAVQTEVSACVAERGLDWSGRMDDLYQRWESDLNQIGMANFGDPFEGTGLNPEEMSQEEIDDFFEQMGPPQLSPDDQERLGTIQAEEIELAIAVNDCGGGPRHLDRLYNEVRIEYEERFLAENADALEPFRNGG